MRPTDTTADDRANAAIRAGATLEAMVHEGAGMPAVESAVDAHVSALKGTKAMPAGELGGWTFAETAWLSA